VQLLETRCAVSISICISVVFVGDGVVFGGEVVVEVEVVEVLIVGVGVVDKLAVGDPVVITGVDDVVGGRVVADVVRTAVV
jgi:hypothetical protein